MIMGALSSIIASSLIWLIYFKGRVTAPVWVNDLPVANAFLNSLCALCLFIGYKHIRRKDIEAHLERKEAF